MNQLFRPPLITGKTQQEQIREIIGYLRQLSGALSRLSLQDAAPADSQQVQLQRNQFYNLRIQNSLTVDGAVNGICGRRIRVWETDRFSIQTQFTQWDDLGYDRQSFLIAGSQNGMPVLCVLSVSSKGVCNRTGDGIVDVRKKENGRIEILLGGQTYDYFIVLSSEPFAF